LTAVLALAPLAHAGSQANPNATDPNDDVSVNDGANCPLPPGLPTGQCVFGTSNDFTFPNADIHAFWANDTADLLLLTVEMKAAAAFERGFAKPFATTAPEDGVFDWTFLFTVAAKTSVASAHMANDGTITCGGVAILCPVHNGNQMTFAIPYGAIGSPVAGDSVAALVFTAHGEDGKGNTLDERAPDANTAADYIIVNATAAAPATNTTSSNSTSSSGSHSGSSSGSASGSHSSSSSSSGSRSGSASSSGSGSASSSASGSTTAKAKGAPGAGLVLVGAALAGAALATRRRL
jgi:hypothetical protein